MGTPGARAHTAAARAAAWWIGAALILGCRGDARNEGLPPASEWSAGTPAGAEPGAGSPAAAGPRARSAVEATRFTACLVRQLAQDPIGSANALAILARSAPPAEARRVIVAVVDEVDRFPAASHAKLLGEAAWALADSGDVHAARKVASRGAALLPDGYGGRLTALATLGRIGAAADAMEVATDSMARDAVAFGAAVGGHRDDAVGLRAETEADPVAQVFVHSAIHLKLVAALGDLPAITAALADRNAPSLLLDAGAVVEGGAYAGNTAVMMAGITALAEARGVSVVAQARALLGAAGTAASARGRPAVDAAIAAFEALPVTARVGLELVPVVAYATVGAIDEARRRFAGAGPSSSSIDRAMIGAGLAAAAGTWNEIPDIVPPNAVLIADIWGHAVAADLDGATRARVLDAICPQ